MSQQEQHAAQQIRVLFDQAYGFLEGCILVHFVAQKLVHDLLDVLPSQLLR